ncbi:MAG: hypothetical protein LBT40_09500 [Deltaproteobacteria bacterium]|jgi:hypothetical protein|nr:hypothetical protein [Deltaproteobacteria bacterium]
MTCPEIMFAVTSHVAFLLPVALAAVAALLVLSSGTALAAWRAHGMGDGWGPGVWNISTSQEQGFVDWMSDPERFASQLLFETWPEWDFPPMTRVPERFRKDAEKASRAKEFEDAMAGWDAGRALAALAYGQDDLRVRAMIGRAARSALLAGFGRPINADSATMRYARAAAACSKWVLRGAELPKEERLFSEATRAAAKVLGMGALGRYFPNSRTVVSFPASRGLPEALWPLSHGWNGHRPELPGDPADMPRPGEDELARRLETIERKGGKGSPRWLETSSRLGEAMAARAFAIPRQAGGAGEAAGALAGEAERLLREAADGLALSRGATHKDAQDARARLALFLMRECGPLRELSLPRGDWPPPEAAEEALGIWRGISEAVPEGDEGENRRTDADLRAAECCAMLGRDGEARRLAMEVVRRRDLPKSHYGLWKPSARDTLALFAVAEMKALGGDIVGAARGHREVLNGFRLALGNHLLTVRSMCRLAELDEECGNGALAAALRAQAAEALEDMAQPRMRKNRGPSEVLKVPEDPDCHFLKCLAARVFLDAGDREEAEAVLGPASEALERFAGARDPRTARAKELLSEARRLPVKGPSCTVRATGRKEGAGKGRAAGPGAGKGRAAGSGAGRGRAAGPGAGKGIAGGGSAGGPDNSCGIGTYRLAGLDVPWPRWPFPRMGSLPEQLREGGEKAVRDADLEMATGNWDLARSLASLAYGPEDPRVLAMLSRAARSCLLQLPGRPVDGDDSLSRNLVAAGAACSARVLEGVGLPDRETAFAAETLRLAGLMAEKVGGSRLSEHVAGLPPSRCVPEVLWPKRSLDGFPEAGLPGDPLLPPGPGSAELARRLAAIGAEEGKTSPGWLEASSRLGDALAAESFSLQGLASVTPGRRAELAQEADKLLRHAARRLASVLGESHRAAQDARARLALFLTRDSGPVRLFALSPGTVPKADFSEALKIWERIMADPPQGPDGALRRKDAALRAAECLAELGLKDRARRLLEDVFGKRPRPFQIPKSPEPPETVVSRSRDALAVFAEGELDMLAGDLASSADAHEDAQMWFRMSLGNSHRLSIRSLHRLADVGELRGHNLLASCMWAMAAEALEELCRKPVTEGAGDGGDGEFAASPEKAAVHVVRSLAAEIFTVAGNRAEAVAALSRQVEALSGLMGRRDARTVWAESLLAEARRLP